MKPPPRGRRARARVGAPTPGDRRAAAARSRRRLARRSRRGRLPGALNKIPLDAWPPALSDRALRRRATCEMLRGNCDKGRRLLGARSTAPTAAAPRCSRTARWRRCRRSRIGCSRSARRPTRRATRATSPRRRQELKQALLRETASPQIQTCFRNRNASRACGRRLAALARAYQVLAESFLVGRDCAGGRGAGRHAQPGEVPVRAAPTAAIPRCAADRSACSRRTGRAPTRARRPSAAASRACRRPKRDGVAVMPDVR